MRPPPSAVAIIIGMLGLKMTRATVETLLDRAPPGIAEQAEAAIRAVPGVVDVERMRVRMVGPTYFIEATVKVPRTFPIDRVEEIKRKAQAAVGQALGDADLTFTAVPVARDNETVRERVMVIARNSGLAVHHVTVHDLGAKLIVSLDLEVDGEMALVPPTTSPAISNAASARTLARTSKSTPISSRWNRNCRKDRMRRPNGSRPSRPRYQALPPTAPSTTSTMCGCATPPPARSLTSIAAHRRR